MSRVAGEKWPIEELLCGDVTKRTRTKLQCIILFGAPKSKNTCAFFK